MNVRTIAVIYCLLIIITVTYWEYTAPQPERIVKATESVNIMVSEDEINAYIEAHQEEEFAKEYKYFLNEE